MATNQKARRVGFKKHKIWSFLSFFCGLTTIAGCLIANYNVSAVSFFFSLALPILFIFNLLFVIFWLVRRKKNLPAPILALLVFFLFFNAPLQLHLQNNKEKPDTFSLMSFNTTAFGSTHYVRNLEHSKKVVDFVKRQDPDIVFFQEFSRFEFQSFSHYPYQFIGYRPDFEKTLQVIYSRYPIVNKGYVDFPDTWNQTIFADIEINNELVRCYNIHLQSFKIIVNKSHFNTDKIGRLFKKISVAQKKKKEQVEIVLDHARTFSGRTIFCGDFNSTPYSKSYKNLKGDGQDTFLEAGFGLGTTLGLFHYPFRIDFIIAKSGIEVLSHKNFVVGLSDHEPIMAKLKLN